MRTGADGQGRGLRDPFSAISHYLGAAFALAYTVWLSQAVDRDARAVGSVLVFGGSMVTLYFASGLYHSVPTAASRLQKFDHAAIYLLIFGTYAPICLFGLPEIWGRALLVAQAALMLAGFVHVFAYESHPRWLRIVLCTLMGWMILVAWRPLNVTSAAIVPWLVAGGVFYSVGTVVYGTKRPRLWPGTFGSHDLWHLFVLAGSACHAVAVAKLMVPGLQNQ